MRRLLPLLLIAASQLAAADNLITVSEQVRRPAADLKPIGVNNFGSLGSLAQASGNLIIQSGFEPVRMRDLYRVIEAGSEGGRHWARLDGPGTANFRRYTSGTYSGAAMRAYRLVDDQGQPVPLDTRRKGEQYLDAAKASACVLLFAGEVLPRGASGLPEGGWQAISAATTAENKALSEAQKAENERNSRVWYAGGQPLRIDDIVMFERSFAWPDPADFHPRTSADGLRQKWRANVGSLRAIPTPADVPAAVSAGAGVGEIIPAGGQAVLWHKLFGGEGRKDNFWYGSLDAGTTYAYSAWVRGPQGASLTLTFGTDKPETALSGYFGTPITKTFTLSGEWQRVLYSFTAPKATGRDLGGPSIRYEGQQPLLIDNIMLQPVYAPGDEDRPFVMHRPLFDTLLASQPATGGKGAARIWAGLSPASMASICSWQPEQSIGLGTFISVGDAVEGNLSLPRALTILEATGDSPATRMVPWIMTQITHSEDEYRQLVEYLAAPYDPARDTPQSKPLAYQRYQQRGHGRPWSADFRELILDFGNENWHNRNHDGWIGVGRFNAVHAFGRDFGLWSRYMIGELRKSPYWDAKVFSINLGGNYNAEVLPDGTLRGYGLEATVAAHGENQYHSHATYIGPRWEMKEVGGTTIDDDGVQRTLMSHRAGNEPEWERQRLGDEGLRALGIGARMTAYEGGPSGFGLRAKSEEEDKAGEYYGKSLAMGTAMLDAWINAWDKGWTWQCYFNYGQGRWWNSHTSMALGHRPSPGWLAMTILNQTFANRDLLTTTISDPATLAVPIMVKGQRGNQPKLEQRPAIYAHAASDGRSLSVAVVNLHLSQAQPVTIVVPMASASRIVRHALHGDPRDTNLEKLAVTLVSDELPANQLQAGRFSTTMPAGTPAVFVFHR